MLIAIDWDGTVSADLELWKAFIALAESRGHEVIVVSATARDRESSWNMQDQLSPGIRVYQSSGQPKARWLKETWGIEPDIWIDDNPRSITCGV